MLACSIMFCWVVVPGLWYRPSVNNGFRDLMSHWLLAHRGLIGLTKLRALSSLNLSDNNAVRDIGLEHLTRLCSLKHLDLSYTGVLLLK